LYCTTNRTQEILGRSKDTNVPLNAFTHTHRQANKFYNQHLTTKIMEIMVSKESDPKGGYHVRT